MEIYCLLSEASDSLEDFCIISGDRCFSGGLLGPDGTNRHLGKWCKRVHNGEQELQPPGIKGSTARIGDLISIGADGRGGKIKILRTLDQSSLVGLKTSLLFSENKLLQHLNLKQAY